MRKLFCLFISLLFCLCIFPLHNDYSFAQTKQIIINTSYSYLYKSPDFSEHYDFKINNQEILTCTDYQNNFYLVSYTFDEVTYTGYIPSEFASPYIEQQDVLLVYNGKIINSTQVYSASDASLMEGIKLDPNHQVYIYEGFDSKKEFTKIKFSYNNQIVTGMVKTVDVKPNGINKAVIISLSIISALVGIILIMLGLSKKKWHKSLKKNMN